MRISANLGFLYTDRALPDAIRAAARDGFDAVECHFPYDMPPTDVAAALAQTGLPMIGLNTIRGAVQNGDFGLSALPDRISEARAAIDQAVHYGAATGARNIHVMAGVTDGSAIAEDTFRENLAYACNAARPHAISILIEPINHRNVPGYHISTVEHAAAIIGDLNLPDLRLMFDCYHVQTTQGGLINRLETYLPIIGHVQIAAVPDRGEPDKGEVNYPEVLKALSSMGYHGFVGAEYLPRDTSARGNLDWLAPYQAI